MVTNEEVNLYSGQIRSNISFSAFMTAVVIFFVGVLLTNFSKYDASVKVPICFLIIGTFGFLYSALIYTNASGEILGKKLANFKRNMFVADVLSEYLGVYLLVLSIPLVINIITPDAFLRVTVALASLLGFAFYQFAHFSISERHFPKTHWFISVLVILLGVILFFAHINSFYFESLAILPVLFVFGLVVVALRKK
jgi:hypothetical protein